MCGHRHVTVGGTQQETSHDGVDHMCVRGKLEPGNQVDNEDAYL